MRAKRVLGGYEADALLRGRRAPLATGQQHAQVLVRVACPRTIGLSQELAVRRSKRLASRFPWRRASNRAPALQSSHSFTSSESAPVARIGDARDTPVCRALVVGRRPPYRRPVSLVCLLCPSYRTIDDVHRQPLDRSAFRAKMKVSPGARPLTNTPSISPTPARA